MVRQTHTAQFAGIGGSGVVYAGTLLAKAGSRHFPHVTRCPVFTASMRGGPCECIVVLSHNPIPSPIVFTVDTLIVLEKSRLADCQERVRQGGLVLLEETDAQEANIRSDIRLLAVPALKIAASLGDILSANLVMVGAYVGASNALPPDPVEKEIESRFSAGKSAAMEKQLSAWRRGLEIGQAFALERV